MRASDDQVEECSYVSQTDVFGPRARYVSSPSERTLERTNDPLTSAPHMRVGPLYDMTWRSGVEPGRL